MCFECTKPVFLFHKFKYAETIKQMSCMSDCVKIIFLELADNKLVKKEAHLLHWDEKNALVNVPVYHLFIFYPSKRIFQHYSFILYT